MTSTTSNLEAVQRQWQALQTRTSAIFFLSEALLTTELTTAISNREKLESQLQENTSVQNVPSPPSPLHSFYTRPLLLPTSSNSTSSILLMCLQEFNNLPEDAKIYKSHGPLLLEQSLSEAQDLVSKRLEYISGEIGRVESVLTELRGKQDDVRGEILKLSNQPVRREVSS